MVPPLPGHRRGRGAGGEPLYDGTAELWWDSPEAMEASFDTEVGKLAGADADAFTQVRLHLYTEEHMVLPGPQKEAPSRKRPPVPKRASKRTR